MRNKIILYAKLNNKYQITWNTIVHKRTFFLQSLSESLPKYNPHNSVPIE
jgi:hypothetical protein